MRLTTPLLLIAIGLLPGARAADHRNLDGGVPITVEDAYPVKFREPTLQGVFGYQRLPGGLHQGGLIPEIEYGIARDWQLNFGPRFAGRSRGKAPGSGNLELSALRNFNTETLRMPALAVKGGVEFPTGAGSHGIESKIQGILTKSAGYHRVHLNAGYGYAASPEPGERRWRREGVVGWDRPVGLQSLLIADVVVRESEMRGNPAVTVIEAGIRRQVTPRQVLSFGVGVGLTGRAERPRLYFNMAISQSL